MPSRQPLLASTFILPTLPAVPSTSSAASAAAPIFSFFTAPLPASTAASSQSEASAAWLGPFTARPLAHALPLSAFHVPSSFSPPAPAPSSSSSPSRVRRVPEEKREEETRPPRAAAAQQRHSSRDVLVECFVSEAACIRWRLQSGSWAEMRDDRAGRQLLCRVFARRRAAAAADGDDGGDDSRLDVSPALFFHLTLPQPQCRSLSPSCAVSLRLYRPHLAPSPSVSAAAASLFPLPAAAESVSLKRVCSPQSSASRHYDAVITAFFSQRRVLQQQQIIAVPLKGGQGSWLRASYDAKEERREEEERRLLGEEQEEENADVNPEGSDSAALEPFYSSVVFFQVASPSSSSSSCIVVEPGVTSLLTEGSMHSAAPYAVEAYLQRRRGAADSPSLQRRLLGLTAMRSQQQALLTLLLPSLSASASSFSLLLIAPPHSLSSALLSSVTAALQLHYCPLSLYSLLSSSPAAASSPSPAFASAVALVASCRPCLVHLQHLSALIQGEGQASRRRSLPFLPAAAAAGQASRGRPGAAGGRLRATGGRASDSSRHLQPSARDHAAYQRGQRGGW